MKTKEIRDKFLTYFEQQHQHAIVPSSSLIPGNDKTLLFTNAGMVQFKDCFLGLEKRNYVRATTSQRCVRAGGKHNDLENVGYTARHHTFFEMLGNFSFGDYFKEQAIEMAWKLLTEELGLSPDKLTVTVFEEDDEAEKIWIEQIGVPKERVIRIGAKDNFWAMGDTGPCGPCSEIFYDHGADVWGGPPGSPEEDGDRFVEIWNLVFMQYNRDENGVLHPLPKPSVDTGMGLERVAAVLQNVRSNYEIDLFQELIDQVATTLGVEASNDNKSLRVIADHIRSIAFLIIDGVTPSNEGRGYVLRRIIRRAVRHGYQQGMREPFMHLIVARLVAEMGEAYPELIRDQAVIEKVLWVENTKFNETLAQGITMLNAEAESVENNCLNGDVVFKLYDTFGFPVDLTADFMREKGIEVDLVQFDTLMEQQRTRARSANKFDADKVVSLDCPSTQFSGYSQTSLETAEVLALVIDGEEQTVLAPKQSAMLVLNETSFYAESGGQAGDSGRIETASGAVFVVSDTQYLSNKVIAHIGSLVQGTLSVGDSVQAKVDAGKRQTSAMNHSATHLLHAALKHVLGSHVQQKGSLVSADRLRFDFSHFGPMTTDELSEVERLVNAQVRANHEVSTESMAIEQAKENGAAALFGEKYEDTVRVVQMGAFSLELCGGTHVTRTGDIGQFKLLSETGVSAGVRRVEVLTGLSAELHAQTQFKQLAEVASVLNTAPEELSARVATLLVEQKALEKKLKAIQAKLALGSSGEGSAVKTINGVPVLQLRMDDVDTQTLRTALDQAKAKVGQGIVIVGGSMNGKVTLIVSVDKTLTGQYKAGALLKQGMSFVGGRGGGKPEMAQGGGDNPAGLDQAMEAIAAAI